MQLKTAFTDNDIPSKHATMGRGMCLPPLRLANIFLFL
jgi:hypothetical protein